MENEKKQMINRGFLNGFKQGMIKKNTVVNSVNQDQLQQIILLHREALRRTILDTFKVDCEIEIEVKI